MTALTENVGSALIACLGVISMAGAYQAMCGWTTRWETRQRRTAAGQSTSSTPDDDEDDENVVGVWAACNTCSWWSYSTTERGARAELAAHVASRACRPRRTAAAR